MNDRLPIEGRTLVVTGAAPGTNTVSFGVVETPMTDTIRGEKIRDRILSQIPMGRWAQPDEVVKTICFLLSDAASYIVGQDLSVNSGYHIAS